MDSDIFREISNMDPVWMALSLFRRGHYQQVGKSEKIHVNTIMIIDHKNRYIDQS